MIHDQTLTHRATEAAEVVSTAVRRMSSTFTVMPTEVKGHLAPEAIIRMKILDNWVTVTIIPDDY